MTATDDPVLGVLERFLVLVCPRRDYHASWLAAQARWTLVDAPLTPGVARAAFEARRPLSAYFPAADGTSHVAAVDVDIEDGGLLVAQRIAGELAGRGARPYLEPSARGAHVWLFLGGAMPATLIVHALRAAIQAVGARPRDKRAAVETRPHDGAGTGSRQGASPADDAAPADRPRRAPHGRVVRRGPAVPAGADARGGRGDAHRCRHRLGLAVRATGASHRPRAPQARPCRPGDSPIDVFNREVGASARPGTGVGLRPRGTQQGAPVPGARRPHRRPCT